MTRGPLTIRRLIRGDEEALDAFLQQHADSSLFLRSNLRAGGIVDEGRPLQASYVAQIEDGRVRGVVAHAWNGNLIFQTPELDWAPELAREAVRASRRPIKGLIGCWAQVSAARAGLGLNGASAFMCSREALLSLPLSSLQVPDPLRRGQWLCRLPIPPEMDLLAVWRRDFQVDTIGEPPFEGMVAECRRSLERHLGEESLFVLVDGQTLASTCTFNARLPDCVQIGGVWTPPELRNRGYARAVVAGALELARDHGVQRAVLFTHEDNRSALKAYRSLGFQSCGDYGLILFNDGHRPSGP